MKSIPWWLWLIPIAALLIATARMPYGYYTFTRIVVCGFSAFVAWSSWEDERPVARAGAIALGLLAVLFNPLIPIHLKRDTWFVLDIGAALLVGAHLALVRLRQH